jgi:hypothetical protein
VPHPLPARSRYTLALVLILSAVSISACERRDDTATRDTVPPGPTAGAAPAACTPPWTGGIESASRDVILGWAAGLSYAEHDSRRYRLYGFPAGAQLQLIGDIGPSRICWPFRQGCMLAKVVTSTALPDRRFAAGTNYIWADSSGGSARAVIIPEDRRAPVVSYPLGHEPHTLGEPPPQSTRRPPGSCMFCGDSCWCFFTMADTSRASILELRLDTGLVRPGSPRP